MAPRFQPGPQLNVVEDLAVKDDPERSVLVADGLLAPAKIEDAEPGAPEADWPIEVSAELIRTTMPDHAQHLADVVLRNRVTVFEIKDSCDAAHGLRARENVEASKWLKSSSVVPETGETPILSRDHAIAQELTPCQGKPRQSLCFLPYLRYLL